MITKHTNNNNLIGFSIRYGLITSILMMLLTLMFFWISGAGSKPVIIWNHVILLIVMYIGVKQYKYSFEDGLISFKQCYLTGLVIGLTTALVFAVFMIIYTKYIDKDLIAFFIQHSEEKLKHYISGEQLKQQIELANKYATPIGMGGKAFIEVALLSLFMPLLMGVFFKKETTEENSEEVSEELTNNN